MADAPAAPLAAAAGAGTEGPAVCRAELAATGAPRHKRKRKFRLPRPSKKFARRFDARRDILPTHEWHLSRFVFHRHGPLTLPLHSKLHSERNMPSVVRAASDRGLICFDTSYLEHTDFTLNGAALAFVREVPGFTQIGRKVVEFQHAWLGSLVFAQLDAVNYTVTHDPLVAPDLGALLGAQSRADVGSVDLYGPRVLAVLSAVLRPADESLAEVWPQLANASQCEVPLRTTMRFRAFVERNRRTSTARGLPRVLHEIRRSFSLLGSDVTVLFLETGLVRVVLPRALVCTLWQLVLQFRPVVGGSRELHRLHFALARPFFPDDFPGFASAGGGWVAHAQAVHAVVTLAKGSPKRLDEVYSVRAEQPGHPGELLGVVTTARFDKTGSTTAGIAALLGPARNGACILRDPTGGEERTAHLRLI